MDCKRLMRLWIAPSRMNPRTPLDESCIRGIKAERNQDITPLMTSSKRFDIVSIGEPMGEFNQVSPGDPHYLFGHGGDTSNAIIAAARAGAKTAYLTALGDDAFGQSFLDLWKREGVDASGVRINPQAHTAVYFVTHGKDGHAFSYLRAGSAAARMTVDDLDHAIIRDTRALHISGISQAISASACDMVFAAIDTARQAGASVSYDPNLRLKLWPLARARAIVEETAAMTDIMRPGLDDARQLTGLQTPDAIADHYLRKGCRIVAMTLGKDGALIATRDERRIVPSLKVKAVDATGAGDCFGGNFLTEWLNTGDPFASGIFAAAAAALSTTGFGAVEPLPKREDVLRAMQNSVVA
jgi:2-dehydro-3-deoxygluconokinase